MGLFPKPNPEIVALAERARTAAGAPLVLLDDGALVLKNTTASYWELEPDYTALMLRLREFAESSLSAGTDFFDSKFWPAVAGSRSALARVCVLDLLTRKQPCPRTDVLDELLRDGRLYFLECASRYLRLGISQRWASLGNPDRESILQNIRRCGREPLGSVSLPGPLLSAVPGNERPPDLDIFLELTEALGWRAQDDVPDESSLALAIPRIPERAPWVPIDGLPADFQDEWLRLDGLERDQIAKMNPAEWAELVDVVGTLIQRALPAPDKLLDHRDLLERLGEFAFEHRASEEAGKLHARLSDESLRNLASWSIDALSAFSVEQIYADNAPFDGVIVGLPPVADLWMKFAELADSLLWEPSLRNDEPFNGGFFGAIEVIASGLPGRLAWNLLARVRGWFRSADRGRPLLWSILWDRVRDGHALSRGRYYLEGFTRVEQRELLCRWLATDVAPPVTARRAFLRVIGEHVGLTAWRRYQSGGPTGSRDFLDEFLGSPAEAGILHDPAMHAYFVGQTVFGAKQALSNGLIPVEEAGEFAARMRRSWGPLVAILGADEYKDPPAFALWVFSPILEGQRSARFKLSPEDRLVWWRALRELALAVVREGPPREVSHLFRKMTASPLLQTLDVLDVLDLLEALGERTKPLTSAELGYRWTDAISAACTVVESVHRSNVDRSVLDLLYNLASTWAARPFVVEEAASLAKNLRS